MPSATLATRIATDFDALAEAQARIRDFLAACSVDTRCIDALDVVLEELGVNVIRHARPADGQLALHVEVRDDRVLLSAEDTGPAFDPTRASLPPPARTLAVASPDGRGLRLARTMSQALHYERRDGSNRLTATFTRG